MSENGAKFRRERASVERNRVWARLAGDLAGRGVAALAKESSCKDGKKEESCLLS